jgi:hypothetical protein
LELAEKQLAVTALRQQGDPVWRVLEFLIESLQPRMEAGFEGVLSLVEWWCLGLGAEKGCEYILADEEQGTE